MRPGSRFLVDETKVVVLSNHSLMDKIKHFYRVDISKSFFDVVDQSGKHYQFSNDVKGFKSFLKSLEKQGLVVMEATGYYHYRLAQYLYENDIMVSFVNPLSVKRFIQMKHSKIKTDKSDAKAICEYAQATEVPLYTARSAVQAECLQLLSLQDLYPKQRTAIKNKIHGAALKNFNHLIYVLDQILINKKYHLYENQKL